MNYPKFTIQKIKSMFGSPKQYVLPHNLRPDFSVEGVLTDLDDIGQILAQKFYAFLMENIKTNRYGYKLKPATLKQKGGWAGDVPWIDTRELISHLMVENTTVGFMEGTYPGTKLDYDQLAMILEYGVKERGIPPRDVFRRSFREFRPIAEAYIKQFLMPVDEV